MKKKYRRKKGKFGREKLKKRVKNEGKKGQILKKEQEKLLKWGKK